MAVPVIDINPLIEEEHRDVPLVVDKIRSVCEHTGYFYISGHGIDNKLTAKLFEMEKKFFDLPADVKNAINIKKSKAYRGYVKPGADVTSNRADIKEGIYFGHEFDEDDIEAEGLGTMRGLNQYPPRDQLPGLKDTIDEYLANMRNIGNVLVSAMALSLGQSKDFFDDMFSSPFPLLALWQYPGQIMESDTWGIGPHTDYGVLTIILQDEVGGLQVETKGGTWIDIPPRHGTFTVLIGDVVEIWTRGLYQATRHRVMNSVTKSRMSVPYFHQPSTTCNIAPLDIELPLRADSTNTNNEPSPATPFMFGDYVFEKFRRSYADRI